MVALEAGEKTNCMLNEEVLVFDRTCNVLILEIFKKNKRLSRHSHILD